jgi:hypothetical protein
MQRTGGLRVLVGRDTMGTMGLGNDKNGCALDL